MQRETDRRVELSMDGRSVGGREVLDVIGEVDVFTSPRLRERALELIDAGARHIVLNLAGVTFLDSTGLGVLVATLKRVKANGGALALVCTREEILKVFRITGLDAVFDIHESVEAAVAAT